MASSLDVSNSRPSSPHAKEGSGQAQKQAAGLPQCSFCSKYSDQIQVVCEGNCLICKVCQVLPATRKLVLSFSKKIFDPILQAPIDTPATNNDFHNNSDPHGRSNGICPLCYKKLARNMKHTIEDFSDMIKLDNDGIDFPSVFKELELGYEDNRLYMFYKYFQDFYPNNGITEINFVENAEEVIKKQSFITHQQFLSLQTSDNSNGELCDGLSSDDENSDAYKRKMAKRLKHQLEADAAKLLAEEHKGRKKGSIHHADSSEKVAAAEEKDKSKDEDNDRGRKEVSRLSVLDPVPKPQPLNMKTLFPGKFLSLVANCFVYLWQLMLRQDYQSLGMVLIRVNTHKSSSQRSNDLRIRAALEFMNKSTSNLNGITSLFSRLVGIQPKPLEYSRSPLGPIVVTVFALGYLWEPWYHNNRQLLFDPNYTKTSPAELRKHINNFTTIKQVTAKQALEIVQMLCTVQQSQWIMSSLTASIGENSSKYPWDRVSISKLIHLIVHFSKSDNMDSSSTVGSTEEKEKNTRKSSDNNASSNHVTSNRKTQKRVGLIDYAHSTRFDKMAELIKAIWKAEPRVHVLSGLQNDVQSPSLDELGSLEKHPHNIRKFCNVNFEQAIAVVGGCSSMNVYDLAYLCVVAWEQEYDLVMQSLNKAIMVSKRRPAVREHFSFEESISKADRLILSRLMKWYSNKGFAGIDWLDMKTRANRLEFTFSIPKTLLEMPPNELEYHCVKIREADKNRAQKELVEDLYDTDGPYAPIGWRLNTPGLSRGNLSVSAADLKQSKIFNGKSDVPISMQDMEAILRAEFLAGQTLGTLDVEPQVSDPRGATLSQSRGATRNYSRGGGMGSSNNTNTASLQGSPSNNFQSNQSVGSFSNDDDNSSLGMTNMIIDQSRKDFFDIYNQAEQIGNNNRDDMFTLTGLYRDHLSPEENPDNYTNQIYYRQRRALPGAKSGYLASLSNMAYESPSPGKFQINLTDVITLGSSDALANTGLLHSSSNNASELKTTKKAGGTGDLAARSKLRSSESSRLSTSNFALCKGSLLDNNNNNNNNNNNTGASRPLTRENKAMSIGLDSSRSIKSTHSALSNGSNEFSNVEMLAAKLEENRIFVAKSRLRHRIANSLESSGQTGSADPDFLQGLKVTIAEEAASLRKKSMKASGVIVNDAHVDIGDILGKPNRGKNDLFMISEAMKHLSFFNTPLTEAELTNILYVNLENGNITGLRVLELNGLNLGIKHSVILAKKFAQKCEIVDLRLPNNCLGDIGLCKILDALITGGSCMQLLNLDVGSNCITYSNQQMQTLAKFSNLQYLDLSRNNISITTSKSQNLFFYALRQFKHMEVLSLAFNSIQDHNFEILAAIIESSMVKLRVLDMEKTFLSGKCIPFLKKLVNLHDPKMVAMIAKEEKDTLGLVFVPDTAKDRATFTREIGLLDNLFSLDHKQELSLACRKSNTTLNVDGFPIVLSDYDNYDINIQSNRSRTALNIDNASSYIIRSGNVGEEASDTTSIQKDKFMDSEEISI